ncbi:MAG: hypothetical protein ABR518_09700 [Actinomycetota bacterium]
MDENWTLATTGWQAASWTKRTCRMPPVSAALSAKTSSRFEEAQPWISGSIVE